MSAVCSPSWPMHVISGFGGSLQICTLSPPLCHLHSLYLAYSAIMQCFRQFYGLQIISSHDQPPSTEVKGGDSPPPPLKAQQLHVYIFVLGIAWDLFAVMILLFEIVTVQRKRQLGKELTQLSFPLHWNYFLGDSFIKIRIWGLSKGGP